jgi:hypothetical protein
MADNQVVKAFSVDVTSGATLSSSIDLQQGWSEVSLEIPSFSSGSNIYIQAAATESGTYSRVMFPPINSATVATNDFTIVSGLANRIIPVPTNYQFIKVELSTHQTDTTSSFNVICKS